MFRCLLKVEVWIQILIQCVWASYTQSQNIAHFATFLFWPFPKFTPPVHAPFKNSYHVYYGLIGNYPSLKMIPNTAYIVLIFKNIIDKCRVCLRCVLGIYIRWRRCVKKQVLFMPMLCAPMKLRYAGDKILVILCKWTILDNKCIKYIFIPHYLNAHYIHHDFFVFRQRAVFCHKIQRNWVLQELSDHSEHGTLGLLHIYVH